MPDEPHRNVHQVSGQLKKTHKPSIPRFVELHHRTGSLVRARSGCHSTAVGF